MTKLELLLKTTATAVGVPLGSVEASWTRLRKARLWTPVGRGRVRPDPMPTDAANLLLSFMVGGLATDTPKLVRMINESRKVMPGEDGERSVALPDVKGLTDLPDTRLGSVLPAIIARLASGQQFIASAQGNLYNLSLHKICVYRSWMGWHTTIGLFGFPSRGDTSERVRLEFWAENPDPDVKRLLSEQDIIQTQDNVVDGSDGGYSRRLTQETVDGEAIRAMAACLQGDAENASLRIPPNVFHEANDHYPNEGVYRDGRAGLIRIIKGRRRRGK
jgi:hypothetical protein